MILANILTAWHYSKQKTALIGGKGAENERYLVATIKKIPTGKPGLYIIQHPCRRQHRPSTISSASIGGWNKSQVSWPQPVLWRRSAFSQLCNQTEMTTIYNTRMRDWNYSTVQQHHWRYKDADDEKYLGQKNIKKISTGKILGNRSTRSLSTPQTTPHYTVVTARCICDWNKPSMARAHRSVFNI